MPTKPVVARWLRAPSPAVPRRLALATLAALVVALFPLAHDAPARPALGLSAAKSQHAKTAQRVARLSARARRACAPRKAGRPCRIARARLVRARRALWRAQRRVRALRVPRRGAGSAPAAGAGPAGAPAAGGGPAGAPAAAPRPGEAGGRVASFETGIVSGSDVVNEARYLKGLNARLVRVEFGIARPASELRAAIAAHAANGTRVLLLAGFHGTMPTVEQARNLGAWAREFGPGGTFWAGRPDGHLAVREIEFGNETSYSYQYGDDWSKPSYSARAREYALRFRDAHEAVQAANPRVGLLAQGDDGGSGSANWVNGMFEAVPDLAGRVAGWTVHPYGPRSRWEPRMDRLIAQTGARGASASTPIWITEWGLASDDGRCLSDNYGWDKCMTYAAAADALRNSVREMRGEYAARLRALILYQGHDQRAHAASSDREHYFGALRADLSDKGAYAAEVRAQLAVSG